MKASIKTARTAVVRIVVGRTEGLKDGIEQYSYQLSRTLASISAASGLKCELVSSSPSGLLSWLHFFKLQASQAAVLHIQYPSEGWGQSVWPGILPALFKLRHYSTIKIVFTSHEWRGVHPLRMASMIPALLCSSAIIFVSKENADAFRSSLIGRLSAILRATVREIPIGVNLGVPPSNSRSIEERRWELRHLNGLEVEFLFGFFGFIYDSKQPDKMIEVVRCLRDRGIRARLILVGDFQADRPAAKEKFLQRIAREGLEDVVTLWGFEQDEVRVSELLSSCNAALQLFSEGLDARRGSFWYLAELGIPIVTTSPQNDKEFSHVDLLSDGRIEFVSPQCTASDVCDVLLRYAKYSVPRRRPGLAPAWEDIGKRHIELYSEILDIR